MAFTQDIIVANISRSEDYNCPSPIDAMVPWGSSVVLTSLPGVRADHIIAATTQILVDVADGKISVNGSTVAGAVSTTLASAEPDKDVITNTATNTANISGITGVTPVSRLAITSTAVLAPVPAADTVLGSLSLTPAMTNTARRTVRYKAIVVVDAKNSGTINFRVKLDAATLFATGTLAYVVDDIITFEGYYFINIVGAAGVAEIIGAATMFGTGAWVFDAGTIDEATVTDTTITQSLSISAESSDGAVGNNVSLIHFEAAVMPA